MTERLGRRARWTAALLVVPGAAGLFGVTVQWAAATRPSTSPASVEQRTPASRADADALASAAAAQDLYRSILLRRAHALALAKTLNTLDHRLAGMIAADRKARQSTAVGTGGTGQYPGPPAQQSVAGPAPAPAPVAVAAPAPPAPPPPAVQVVTGASGA